MAVSLSHKFGQIIGDLLEIAVEPLLREFCNEKSLYLDKKGERVIRGTKKKLTWSDTKGNSHDLDFVIEKDGSEEKLGNPVAFIEIAWRRYTKHSRNKAQEIQGAIIPLFEKYSKFSPFKGVILAGEFTSGALSQLNSLGFTILYFPYKTVVEAFKFYGIDASFNEGTPEQEFKNKIDQWYNLENNERVAKTLLEINKEAVDNFFKSLSISVGRQVDKVIILPLSGTEIEFYKISDAITALEDNIDLVKENRLIRYEAIVRYTNGDEIDAKFKEKGALILFLKGFI